MESSTTLIYSFLLLSHLPLFFTTTFQVPITGITSTNDTQDPMSTVYPFLDPNSTTNGTVADCLIDNKMAMVAIASAVGVIVCLLVSTLVLACQVRCLQKRIGALRPSHSKMDLVSSSDYWGPGPPEAGGLEGPCDASIVLEEMRPFIEIDSNQDEVNTRRENELEQGGKRAACDPEEVAERMQLSSMSDARRDSKDLENTPLVV